MTIISRVLLFVITLLLLLLTPGIAVSVWIRGIPYPRMRDHWRHLRESVPLIFMPDKRP